VSAQNLVGPDGLGVGCPRIPTLARIQATETTTKEIHNSMLSMKRVFGVLILLCSFIGLAVADQPHMQAARTHLQQARAQLQAASHNKGGHRTKAIEHVNNAIGLVNKGINFDRRHNHALSALAKAFNSVLPADQPHMQAALDHLRQAKSELELATSDKGGYRVKAIEEVNAAIDETKKGIDAGE
jgi:histidinol-phosphate/aromatic aminotransferase/cobyric acid decarboxylase-like protein